MKKDIATQICSTRLSWSNLWKSDKNSIFSEPLAWTLALARLFILKVAKTFCNFFMHKKLNICDGEIRQRNFHNVLLNLRHEHKFLLSHSCSMFRTSAILSSPCSIIDGRKYPTNRPIKECSQSCGGSYYSIFASGEYSDLSRLETLFGPLFTALGRKLINEYWMPMHWFQSVRSHKSYS